MRLGVLSDVHGNARALTAVLDRLDRLGVDGYVCAGDVVGYGPRPNECIELLAERDALCVAGNHDLLALGVLDESRTGVLALQTLAWTRQQLTPASWSFLAALPRVARRDGLRVAHGSPADPEEYVRSPARAAELLAAETDDRSPLLVVGHTHHQWVVDAAARELLLRRTGTVVLDRNQRHLLNPGSVGQSRDRDDLSRFLLLDTEAGVAHVLAVEYDVAGSVDDLRSAGLPVRALHPTHRSPREVVLGARRRLTGWARRRRAASASS